MAMILILDQENPQIKSVRVQTADDIKIENQ